MLPWGFAILFRYIPTVARVIFGRRAYSFIPIDPCPGEVESSSNGETHRNRDAPLCLEHAEELWCA